IEEEMPAAGWQGEFEWVFAGVDEQEQIFIFDRRAALVALGKAPAEEQQAERARRGALPIFFGHRRAGGREPDHVLRLRVGAAAKRRMALAHGDERAHELEQALVGALPVEPGELAVLAIGVVV